MAALIPATLHAGQFQISPTLIELQAPSKATSLTVTNLATAPLGIQTRVYRWTQSGGEEVLTPTTEVVTSPPIATVPPGAQQLVRVLSLGGTPPNGEDAYRILVDELPVSGEQGASEVRVLLRYSIPMFMQSARKLAGVAPRLSASVSAANQITLTAGNAGERRIRLSDLTLMLPGQDLKPFGSGLVGYVLAGGQQRWSAQLGLADRAALRGTIPIRVTTEMGEIREQLAITPGG